MRSMDNFIMPLVLILGTVFVIVLFSLMAPSLQSLDFLSSTQADAISETDSGLLSAMPYLVILVLVSCLLYLFKTKG